MLTEESLNNSTAVDIDIDQESTSSTNTVKSSSKNTELVSCVAQNDTTSSVVNNQNQDLTDTKDDISSSNDPAVSMLVNSNAAFAISSNGSNPSHQGSVRSTSQNGKTESKVASFPKTFCKVKQYHSTSINLTKRKTLRCKMLIAFAIYFTTRCSLILCKPIWK